MGTETWILDFSCLEDSWMSSVFCSWTPTWTRSSSPERSPLWGSRWSTYGSYETRWRGKAWGCSSVSCLSTAVNLTAVIPLRGAMGYCFVEMSDEATAERCLRKINGKSLPGANPVGEAFSDWFSFFLFSEKLTWTSLFWSPQDSS